MPQPELPQPHPLPETPYARVLVIDDSPDCVELFRKFLARRGFQVAAASDGARGLAKARWFRPQVILLNLLMPVMSGDECLPLLRAEPALARTKILLHSAYRGVEGVANALGADAFLRVPFPIKPLVATVARLAGEANKADWERAYRAELEALFSPENRAKLTVAELKVREDEIRIRLRSRYFPSFRDV